ncbi:MAG: hypothetical protein ABI203_06230 [Mucilaginibacter sp.]
MKNNMELPTEQKGFNTNIEKDTMNNANFRKVSYTGEHLKGMLMNKFHNYQKMKLFGLPIVASLLILTACNNGRKEPANEKNEIGATEMKKDTCSYVYLAYCIVESCPKL